MGLRRRALPVHPSLAGGRVREGQHGQALVEFAFVMAIMLVMALAVFDLGRGFYNSLLLTQAARDGARVAMDCDAGIDDIRDAALAAAPASSSVVVSPDPRPACPANNSTTTTTTVTLTYTHEWIIPFWSGWDLAANQSQTPWGTTTMVSSALSR